MRGFFIKKLDKFLAQPSKTKIEYVSLVLVWHQKTKYSVTIY